MKTLLALMAIVIGLMAYGQDVQLGALRINYWTSTTEGAVTNTIISLAQAQVTAGSNQVQNTSVGGVVQGVITNQLLSLAGSNVINNLINSATNILAGNNSGSLTNPSIYSSGSSPRLNFYNTNGTLAGYLAAVTGKPKWFFVDGGSGMTIQDTNSATVAFFSADNVSASAPIGSLSVSNLHAKFFIGDGSQITNISTANQYSTNLTLVSNVTLGFFPWERVNTNVIGITGAGIIPANGTYIQTTTVSALWTNISGNGSSIAFVNPIFILSTNGTQLYSTTNLFFNSVWLDIIGSTSVPTNSGFGYVANHVGQWDTNVWASSLVGKVQMQNLDTKIIVTNGNNSTWAYTTFLGNPATGIKMTNNVIGMMDDNGVVNGYINSPNTEFVFPLYDAYFHMYFGNGAGLTNITTSQTNISYRTLTNSAAVVTNDSRPLFFYGNRMLVSGQLIVSNGIEQYGDEGILNNGTGPMQTPLLNVVNASINQGLQITVADTGSGDRVTFGQIDSQTDFFFNAPVSVAGIYDTSAAPSVGNLSIESNSRKLYASSGLTEMLNWSTAANGLVGNGKGLTGILAAGISTNGSSANQVLTSIGGNTVWTNSASSIPNGLVTNNGTANIIVPSLTLTNQAIAGLFTGTGTNLTIATLSTNADGLLLTNYVMLGNNVTGNALRLVGTNSTSLALLNQLGNLTIAGQYNGNAAGLTNLNASQLITGTVPSSSISGGGNGSYGGVTISGSTITPGNSVLVDGNGYTTRIGTSGIGNGNSAFKWASSGPAIKSTNNADVMIMTSTGVGWANLIANNVTAIGGVATYANKIPTAVTVGASPFTFSNATPVALECWIDDGAALFSITKNGVAVRSSLAGSSGQFTLMPTNVIVLTYPVTAPTFTTNTW